MLENKIKKICDPYDLLALYDQNYMKEMILLINIDRGYILPEYLITRVYENTPQLRTIVVKNTNKTKFEYSDNLIIMNKNFVSFMESARSKFKKIYFVTQRNRSDYELIKQNLTNIGIVFDSNTIINSDDIIKLFRENKTILYVDSSEEQYYKLNYDKNSSELEHCKFILMKMNLFL